MNKGMIMEVKKSYAIALNDEGIMDKIRFKKDMRVGQKVFYFDDDIVKTTRSKIHRHNNFIKAFGSIAALFLLVFTFFNMMNYEQAYAIVSLDINPSIQIEADSNTKVLKVEGINDDGKTIDFKDIKGLDINEAIKRIKEKLVEKKYLDTNNEVLVGVAFTSNDDNGSYEETLQDAIRTTFNTEDITYVKADKEEVEEAKTEGISLGRYKAKESIAVDKDTKDNIGKAPVKEITALIKDKKNVIQWDAKDEKVVDVPVINTEPEIKNDNSTTNINLDTDTDTNINTNVDTDTNVDTITNKPNVNADSENINYGVDKEKETTTKPKNNDVLEVEPDIPVVVEKDTNTTDSNTVNTEQNSVTIDEIQDDIKANKAESKMDVVIEDKKN
jgi:hypothetical protein